MSSKENRPLYVFCPLYVFSTQKVPQSEKKGVLDWHTPRNKVELVTRELKLLSNILIPQLLDI